MWVTLIPIIATYGLPLAEKLFQLWTTGSVPTQADFDALKALASVTATQQMTAQLNAAGIPLTDPHAIALINLTSGTVTATATMPPPPTPPTTSVAPQAT